MKTLALLVFSVFAFATARAASAPEELARWQERARNVTITRDQWGIAHVSGKSDADAVFGFLYAQAEDDFPRIELNYIDASGRRAEVDGEAEIYRDLRMKLFIDPTDMRAKYAQSPAWLRELMEALADGLNFYLHTHPNVKPRLITRFEPWMALTFSEGSIGGDIESVSLRELKAFYGKQPVAPERPRATESKGSNGFAIAPQLSASGHALLLINPHTTFYFRPEVHVASEAGLNAYGAVTWGQFFVYQGFNERCGWMHTSDGGDVIDEYAETITEKPARSGRYVYRYGTEERAVTTKTLVVPYRHGAGRAEKTFTAYFTHHGPIVREAGGKWLAVKLMQDPVNALMQSYLRTKAKNYADFYRTMELRTNTSNNTVYADTDGTIAYFHGDFVPRRDAKFDWNGVVDGSDPATEWRGLHAVDEIITLKNPANGWIQNTNNWPFSAAGPNSPRVEDFPRYMWTNPENARGRHAVRVLAGQKDFTLDSLIATAYDPMLVAFEQLLPPLFSAFDALPAGDAQRTLFADPIALLRAWDRRCSVDSVPAAVAILWAQELAGALISEAKTKRLVVIDHLVASTNATQRLDALTRALKRLEQDFGTWKTPWGAINRFQRLSGDINATFDDDQPSLPIGLGPSDLGALAAFGPASAPTGPRTKKIYGTRGNSFVAVVEFGPRLKAKSLLAGGVSGDPRSPHFMDQAERYARGQFKDVLFYREDIERHAERKYRPGE